MTRVGTMCAALAITAMVGCATPGAPLPPSLDLPKPVSDLRATRMGDQVTLNWTLPTETTDKQRIRRLGATVVCRAVQPVPNPAPNVAPETKNTCAETVATVAPSALKTTPAENKGTVTATFTDKLREQLEQQHPAGAAEYAVRVENTRGRDAGWSNTARVPLAPTSPPPADFQAQPSRAGILLTWTPGSQQAEGINVSIAGYRVERTQPIAATPDEKLFVESTSPNNGRLLDSTFEWGKTYSYRIAAVTAVYVGTERTAQVQGAWSEPHEVAMRDVFPPAQPAGVQAVYTAAGAQQFIDLTWMPSSDPDLAGYNVYRRTAGSEPVKISRELVKSPAYRDNDISAGARYFYSVSAVDLRGNESAKSPEARESVPKQP